MLKIIYICPARVVYTEEFTNLTLFQLSAMDPVYSNLGKYLHYAPGLYFGIRASHVWKDVHVKSTPVYTVQCSNYLCLYDGINIVWRNIPAYTNYKSTYDIRTKSYLSERSGGG